MTKFSFSSFLAGMEGAVYKGTMAGITVAVKRINKDSRSPFDQSTFLAEATILQ
jgi:hypothetical protein